MDTISRKTNIPKPSLEWEEGTYSLEEVLSKFHLPRVAECDPDESNIPIEGPNFQLLQPLALYRERCVKKVPARSLCVNRDSKKYIVLGDPLLIPESYSGWFAVLGIDGSSNPEDKVIPHYKTVAHLATSNTDRFLVGGKRSVYGLNILDRTPEMKHLKFEKVEFPPGTTLKKGKIFIGQSTKKKKHRFSKAESEPEKFLMCTDELEREVILPLTQNATFYTISGTTGKIHRPVMQMAEIVSQKLTPCVVTILVGKGPTTPALFTGLLGLYEPEEERSILASTIMNFRNIMLELPVESCMKFRVAKPSDELQSHKGYQSSLAMCKERAESYTRNIKVCYDLQKESNSTPEGTPTSRKKQKSGAGPDDDDEIYQDLWKTKEGKNRVPSKMIPLSQLESSTDGSIRMPPAGFSLRSTRSSVRVSIVNSSMRVRNPEHPTDAGVYIDFAGGESSTDFRESDRTYDNSVERQSISSATASQSRHDSARGYSGGSITSNTPSAGYESIPDSDNDYTSISSAHFKKGHDSQFQIRRTHTDQRASAASLFDRADSKMSTTMDRDQRYQSAIVPEGTLTRVSPDTTMNGASQNEANQYTNQNLIPAEAIRNVPPEGDRVQPRKSAAEVDATVERQATPNVESSTERQNLEGTVPTSAGERPETPPPDYYDVQNSDDSWGDDFDEDEPGTDKTFDYENVESLRELMAQLAWKRSESNSGSSSETSEMNSQADETSLKDIPVPDA